MKHDFAKDVMEEIHTKKIKMKPKSYFYVGSAFLALGLAGSIVVAVFFVNIVTFHIRYYEVFELVGFGPDALLVLLQLVPWVPLGVALLGTSTGMYFLKQYDISYKSSFNALAAGTVIMVVVTGVGLDYVGVSRKIQAVGPLGPLYHVHAAKKPQWITGIIANVEPNAIRVIGPRGNEIIITHNLKDQVFEEGMKIHAIGVWENGSFTVKEIHIKEQSRIIHLK